MNKITQKYINMIQAFECDFRLVIDETLEHNISKLLRNKKLNKKLLKDIELLEELSFDLRNEKIEIVEKKELRKKSEIIADFLKMDYNLKEENKEKVVLIKGKKELFINLKDKYFFKEDILGNSKTIKLEELKLISDLMEGNYEPEF